MNKASILDAIKRLAAENGGVPPGQSRFEQATGLGAAAWRGKYWARWGDAITEAGLTPNQANAAMPQERVVEQLALLALRVGHVPTYGEVRLAREADKSFPAHMTIQRLGSKEQRHALLRALAESSEKFRPLLAFLPNDDAPDALNKEEKQNEGFVYMAKMGKHFKIGKTIAVPRRHREIALQLPESLTPVHAIRTDDPYGIEAYWHKRFEAKRTNGEWFALSVDDVRAFKKRKFM